MDEKMIRFLKSVGIENISSFDMSFDLVKYDLFNPKQLNMVIRKETPWDYSLLRQFIDHLSNISYQYKLNFCYSNFPQTEEVKNMFYDWYQELYRVPSNVEINVKDNNLIFILTSLEDSEKYKSIIKDYQDFLNFIGYDFSLEIKENIKEEKQYTEKEIKKIIKVANKTADETIEDSNVEDDLINGKSDIEKQADEEHRQLTIEVEDAMMEIMLRNKREMDRERERARRNKTGDYKPIDKISEINKDSGNVDFNGTIFQVEEKNYGKTTIINLGINDNENGAIKVTMKENGQLNREFIDGLKVKMNVRIRGCAYLDDYNGQLTIKGHYINLLPPEEIAPDDAEIKRVELHLHTNYSVQDGVTTIKDYVNYAKALGHKSMAITDHGVVQGFPEAQATSYDSKKKEFNFHMIYGCEFYLVDDDIEFIKNPANIPLNKAKYCVLDLETTGLSSRYDSIIEFGGVLVEGGLVTSRLDILINPGFHIPESATAINHITDDDVKNCKSIEEELPRIMKFIGDAIVVTHNAKFDVNFLQEALKKCGMPLINNPIIDTLALSHYLFPESKRHSLGALCKNMDIKYDEEGAHRADYDAEVLNDVWQPMIERLNIDNKNLTHKDLADLEVSSTLLTHIRPTHCVALIKNKAGIRDMYELVSIAHTQYYSGVPRIPKSVLSRLRSNLIISSGCLANGYVFDTAKGFNKDLLKESMKFFDYIEVQPKENLSYLINWNSLNDSQIEQYIKDVIEAADELGKPVVATGDVHYLTPGEKKFRDVYISATPVGGGLHPLAKRRDNYHYDNPDQHYRSTKEMLECFKFLGEEKAYEIVVKNSNMIADMIEDIVPVPNDGPYAPHIENCEQILHDVCYNKAYELYGNPLPEPIQNRLDREFDGITKSGYANVYYLAHKLVKYTNDNGHIVGSRGSVGSSFVATMAGITEVNPLPPYYLCPKCKKLIWGKDVHPDIASGYDLPPMKCPDCGSEMETEGQNIPFETFLGLGGDKVPDIDLNFPRDFQATAHQYTKVLVGEHNVFKAGTIETVADKTAFGFARGLLEEPYVFEYMNQGIEKKQAQEMAKKKIDELYSQTYIDYLASGCIGVKRTTGQHPGGIVVLPEGREIYEFTPIQYPADEQESNWTTTHFDFESIHDTLLKLDMLGHLDPMALKMMCDLTGINIKDIPLNDKKVLSLFNSAKELKIERDYLGNQTGAMALPEFGTDNTRRTLDETRPQTFNDLVILSGLSHGTGVWAGNAEDLILQGTATLQDVIGCRDDIMTFLMSKGIEPKTAFAIMETVRKKNKFLSDEFKELMRASGVPEYYIESADKIEYLFPKGHACAYVIMAVRVAYFKLYYPLEFYATYFTVRSKQYEISTMIKGEIAIIDRLDQLKLRSRSKTNKLSTKEEDIYKTLQISIEMIQRGYRFENISLTKSDATKFIVDKENKALIPPFITIDGLGENNAITVIKARNERPFSSKEDLLKRTQLSSTNVEVLSDLGVLDELSESEQISLFDF